MAARPLHLPPLPDSSNELPYASNILKAYEILADSYDRSTQLLRLEDGDPIRLRLHSERFISRILPILNELSPALGDYGWAQEVRSAILALMQELDNAAATAESVNAEDTLERPAVVSIIRSGHRGRPRLTIDSQWLQNATSGNRKIPLTTLSRALGIHRNTLRKKLKESGHVRLQYSDITDDDLDRLIHAYKEIKPTSGIRYVTGFLLSNGLRVQRMRIQASLQRADGLGQVLRNHAAIDRRIYTVPHSNYLWHIDGHHKLIRWGIVLHGGADGSDRTMVMLQANTDNRSTTVLHLFLSAGNEYGFPSRVRGDRGGENIDVAIWMIKHRGPNRASFMWGSSTRNTRIERMWVEVGTQFAIRWRAFFVRLEKLHGLDPGKPGHLWLLHHLFLDSINNDCDAFQQEWNHHPISGAGRNQSPLDMRLLSHLEHGTPQNDYLNDVHPDVLARYYGINGPPTRHPHGHTGAGHYDVDTTLPSHIRGARVDSSESDESDSELGSDSSACCTSPEGDLPESGVDEEELNELLTGDQRRHVRHPAIPVPDDNCPFTSTDTYDAFLTCLHEVQKKKIVPEYHGVSPREWINGTYDEVVEISYGRSGRKAEVQLPFKIWWVRAVEWAQGMDVMTRLLLREQGEI